MNILVLGSGGREHAICWKIKESKRADKIYCAPGNAGTAKVAENYDIDISNNEKVKEFCLAKNVNLVVVGPEMPLSRGITDLLEEKGILVCGPSYAASRMESSKIFAKELMGRYNIPTASFRIFDRYKDAEKHIEKVGAPIVIKADGLAGGKGVFVAGTVEEAKDAAKSILEDKMFGAAGGKLIVEECLIGEEVSVIVATDGINIIPFVSTQDHKRAFDGDEGPNTGGMGAYAPAPVLTKELYDEIYEKILKPTVDGMRNEEMPYKGFLYAGIMVTSDGPKVLEYNVRFGDPECQAILPKLKTDFVELIEGIAKRDISSINLEWDERDCICVVLVSGGYPGEYTKGKAIEGIEEAEQQGTIVFHAGTKKEDGKPVTSGGRVLNVVGLGNGIKDAIDTAYKGVSKINFDGMFYRKDIAHRALNRA
ncbi:MAG: phosphoribosylamine--glycine ligase [Candidatus Omnitrophica bacterium]|nr:phosphoribosylamine--glycine ligase [Candidatus Omnitrophota bacterium]